MTQQTQALHYTIDHDRRSEIILKLTEEIQACYVFPEVASQLANSLLEDLQQGAFDGLDDAVEFCDKITEHLQAINHDKHLRLRFGDRMMPLEDGAFEKQAELNNYYFQKVERLAGNIGYLDLRQFLPPELAAETAYAAMNFLSSTSALIIDLRQNGGGDPRLVALLCSYFFAGQRVHLNSMYYRKDDLMEQFWTHTVPGKKYLDKPIYILTSSYTFSAAEEFSYNLKNLNRATLVGETTGGGAHPGGNFTITEGFQAFIPTGRAINPITNTNWEGVGVAPDVSCTAEAAFDIAYREALAHVIEQCENRLHHEKLRKEAQEALQSMVQ